MKYIREKKPVISTIIQPISMLPTSLSGLEFQGQHHSIKFPFDETPWEIYGAFNRSIWEQSIVEANRILQQTVEPLILVQISQSNSVAFCRPLPPQKNYSV